MNKNTLYSFLGVIVLVIIGFIVSSSISIKPAQKVTQNIPVSSVTATTTMALSPQEAKLKVISLLTASTDRYESLLSAGKFTLGTTQYISASDALVALNNSTSPASAFGAFRTNTCIKNDSGADAVNAYREADDLYPGTSPDALSAWNEDMNTAASDLCVWAGDAVDWQIRKVSDAKLREDEHAISVDIARARTDIKAISI